MGFVGDTDGSTPEQIYINMKTKGVTKLGHIGDLSYSSSASTQLGYITNRLGFAKDSMVCSIGNHDHPNEDGSQGVLDSIASYFNLPTSTYAQSRQWQNVYVIAMNTQDSNFDSTTSAQYTYVKSELEKATALKTQGSVNWIIVLIHKPFYIGSGNDHPADEEGGRSIYQTLFDQHGVDFVFHGHNHNIDCFKPLTSGGTLLATVSNNVYDFTKPHGQFYMTIGSGGRSRDSVSTTTNSLFATGGSFGYCLMTLNNTGLIMQVQILSPSGSVLNEFQVSKQGVPPATGGGGGTDPPPTGGGGAGNPPADLPSTAVLKWDSGIWSNGQQRTITCHECPDPFDSRARIAAGSGRVWFIDGQGSSFISGDQSRLYVDHNSYNHVWDFKFTWNGNGIEGLSLRSRSRHNEGGSESNRFGGYGLSIHNGSVEWAREDYHNVHTDMSPSETTGTPAMVNGKEYGCRIFCYDNSSGKPTLKLYLDSGSGYVLIGTAIDPDPEAYMLDKALYHSKSQIWIRTNGGGTKDVKIRDLKIYDLGDNYTG
jgi:calcineurin-like phosphoesterase family protein